jgi:hypothetical protein
MSTHGSEKHPPVRHRVGWLAGSLFATTLLTLLTMSSAGTASAQTVTFRQVGSLPAPADVIRVQGSLAYVAGGRVLTIFNVSNPAAPKREGAYTFAEAIWAFRVFGSTAYVGANFFGLGILDVSNPAKPTLQGSFKTPGQAKTAAMFGSKIAVIDHMKGVLLLDGSDPGKPRSLGSFFLEGYARDVVTSGPLAFAVDSPSGFYIFDLSKPGPLEPISSIQSGSELRSVEVSDSLAVLVGGGTLQPYDVSNPAAPVKAPPYRTPGGARHVALKGKLAYVADGREGLLVLDLTNPVKPMVVGAYKTPGPAQGVAVADSLVFVITGDARVKVRGANPDSPDAPLATAAAQGGGQVLILREMP